MPNAPAIRIPYRLLELLAAPPGSVLHACEGEKDADTIAALGLVATSASDGAGKWPPSLNHWFTGFKQAIIFEDNDEAGRKHAQLVARELTQLGIECRIVSFPELPPKKDVSDWLALGHTKDGLLTRCKEAPVFVEPPPIVRAEDWLKRDLPDPDRLISSWFTTTSRVLASADTGKGKSNIAMALAGHLGAGVDFLHWRIPQARSVLYIDGEMSARLFKLRIADVVRRLGGTFPSKAFFLNHEDVRDWQPLNTEDGQKFIHKIVSETEAEAVIFDNVMALILGDMRDEEAWRDTLPLITQLTARRVGQLWIHHTGHDASRGYGTKTREWRMDTVIHGTEVKRPDTDISLRLEFRKNREKTPETRQDFADVTVALVGDKWVCDRQSKPASPDSTSPNGQKFLQALRDAFAKGPTQKFQSWEVVTMDQWRNECLRLALLNKDAKANQQRAMLYKYRLELIGKNHIVCNDELIWFAP